MKNCLYCGASYSDETQFCAIDQQPLQPTDSALQVERSLEAVSELSVETAPEQVSIPLPATTNRMRLAAFIIICGLSFIPSIDGSVFPLLFGEAGQATTRTHFPPYAWFSGVEKESFCLALLWFVFKLQGRRFADLGLTWKRGDFLKGTAIWLTSYWLFRELHAFLQSVWGSDHFSMGHVGIGWLFYAILNPFYEELIVRAYLMTEVVYFSKNTLFAVLASAVLQTLYHLYQGKTLAIPEGTSFLIFSIYYARTNRITPVIIAHMIFDVLASMTALLR